MKKIAYMTPEMEIVKMVEKYNLLTASGGSGSSAGQGGEGDPELPLD